MTSTANSISLRSAFLIRKTTLTIKNLLRNLGWLFCDRQQIFDDIRWSIANNLGLAGDRFIIYYPNPDSSDLNEAYMEDVINVGRVVWEIVQYPNGFSYLPQERRIAHLDICLNHGTLDNCYKTINYNLQFSDCFDDLQLEKLLIAAMDIIPCLNVEKQRTLASRIAICDLYRKFSFSIKTRFKDMLRQYNLTSQVKEYIKFIAIIDDKTSSFFSNH